MLQYSHERKFNHLLKVSYYEQSTKIAFLIPQAMHACGVTLQRVFLNWYILKLHSIFERTTNTEHPIFKGCHWLLSSQLRLNVVSKTYFRLYIPSKLILSMACTLNTLWWINRDVLWSLSLAAFNTKTDIIRVIYPKPTIYKSTDKSEHNR